MAKKKKKESPQIVVGNGEKRDTKKDDILNTSAGELMLDINKKDPDVQPDSLLTIEARLHPNIPANTMVFSMRMEEDLLNHVKQIAREMSYKSKKNISYQAVINDAVISKYPLPKEE
jgi:hypothetical protein